MMIVQPTSVIAKHQNQVNRECLYAWYPEAINGTVTIMEPRDIYIHNGLDKDLLEQNPQTNGLTSAYYNSNSSADLLQRHKQTVASNDRAYHSAETIDEALRTPWASHYEIKRGPATPNFPLNSSDMPTHEEPPRRLKSAPIVRSLPPTAMLAIPEPRFINVAVPIIITNPVPLPASVSRPRTRASSAKARLNTTVPNEVNQQRREIRSAQIYRPKSETRKLSEEEIQQIFKRVYGDKVEQPQQQQQVQIIYTHPATSNVSPPPVYVYQKSASWCGDEVPSSPIRNQIEVRAVPLNPHYIHRPGVIAVRNVEKKSVVRDNSAWRKPSKRHRKRNEPLLALTPLPQRTRLSLEIDGVKLTHDHRLTLDDKSSNLTKYFIDGRLYLIKDQRYNVIDNIDPSVLTHNSTPPQHQKHYRTIPVDKFQRPESYSYNTSPKHAHRYVIDPNLISENLNVNRMYLSTRPPTATVYA